MIDFINGARKFLVALTAALGVLALALADGHVDNTEYFQVLVAFIGALGVYKTQNRQ